MVEALHRRFFLGPTENASFVFLALYSLDGVLE